MTAPVERLREAARVLRERSEVATPGPWRQDGNAGSEWDDQVVANHRSGNPAYVEGVADTDTSDENAAYIATMHPGVGAALADWLDTAGADLWAHGPLCDCGSGCHDCDDDMWQPHARRALAVADQILGGAS